MPRIVVTTAGGDPVRSLWASNAELVRRVVEMIEALPDLPLYIEGEELPREQRASLLAQAAQVREATTRAAQAMTPGTSDDLMRGYDELRRVTFHSARELSLLVLTHNRAVVEDSIKARYLLHQSLDDIDAIERSVTVARVKKIASLRRYHLGGPRRGSFHQARAVTTVILAHIRAIRTGHSARARIEVTGVVPAPARSTLWRADGGAPAPPSN